MRLEHGQKNHCQDSKWNNFKHLSLITKAKLIKKTSNKEKSEQNSVLSSKMGKV